MARRTAGVPGVVTGLDVIGALAQLAGEGVQAALADVLGERR